MNWIYKAFGATVILSFRFIRFIFCGTLFLVLTIETTMERFKNRLNNLLTILIFNHETSCRSEKGNGRYGQIEISIFQ